MAHLWLRKMDGERLRWAVLPLAGSSYQFIDTQPFIRRSSPARADREALMRIQQDGVEHWLLVLPPTAQIWVNGRKPLLGAHVLTERDEIRGANGRRLYFSTERLQEVVLFPGGDREMCCARCRNQIAKDALALNCPGCGTWCHQSEELPCWRYSGSTHCPLCDQSNDPDAGFRWTPTEL
jgi:hypothetical protein